MIPSPSKPEIQDARTACQYSLTPIYIGFQTFCQVIKSLRDLTERSYALKKRKSLHYQVIEWLGDFTCSAIPYWQGEKPIIDFPLTPLRCLCMLTDKFNGRSFSGRTADSDSANQGSNPCLPANKIKGLVRYFSFFSILAHESRNVTVRLNTSAPPEEALESTQK